MGQERLTEAVPRWTGVRSGLILESGPDEMSNHQLGFLMDRMRVQPPSVLTVASIASALRYRFNKPTGCHLQCCSAHACMHAGRPISLWIVRRVTLHETECMH